MVFYFNVSDIVSETMSDINVVSVDTVKPEITINSPEQNSVFYDKKVRLDIITNYHVAVLEFKDLHSIDPNFKKLC